VQRALDTLGTLIRTALEAHALRNPEHINKPVPFVNRQAVWHALRLDLYASSKLGGQQLCDCGEIRRRVVLSNVLDHGEPVLVEVVAQAFKELVTQAISRAFRPTTRAGVAGLKSGRDVSACHDADKSHLVLGFSFAPNLLRLREEGFRGNWGNFSLLIRL
jgi:hypothetical protein